MEGAREILERQPEDAIADEEAEPHPEGCEGQVVQAFPAMGDDRLRVARAAYDGVAFPVDEAPGCRRTSRRTRVQTYRGA